MLTTKIKHFSIEFFDSNPGRCCLCIARRCASQSSETSWSSACWKPASTFGNGLQLEEAVFRSGSVRAAPA
jgi:hypothetical protein